MTGENSRFGFLSAPVALSPLTQTTHLVYIYITLMLYSIVPNTQSLRVMAQLTGPHSHIFSLLPPGDEAS